jgi:hypothetical protein
MEIPSKGTVTTCPKPYRRLVVSVSYRDKKLVHEAILFERLLLPLDLTFACVPVRRPESVERSTHGLIE